MANSDSKEEQKELGSGSGARVILGAFEKQKKESAFFEKQSVTIKICMKVPRNEIHSGLNSSSSRKGARTGLIKGNH